MKNTKTIILDSLIEKVEKQIKNAEHGRQDALDESKAHKGAMESRYDTFKEEAQYLAGGFATMLADLRKTLEILRSVRNRLPSVTKGANYALIEAQNLDDGSLAKYFLLPTGGGSIHEIEGEKTIALNINAPLAHAFVGAVAGNKVEVSIQGKTRRFYIVSIT